jgi:hypothetical protein
MLTSSPIRTWRERGGQRSRLRLPVNRTDRNNGQGGAMIVLGIILLLIGFIAKIAILWTIGIVLVLVGLVLMLLGSMGRAVGGRRHYY